MTPRFAGRAGQRRRTRRTARSLVRQLPNLVMLVVRLLRDPAMPRLDRILFGAILLYVVTPVDLIPDFLGFLGLVDDLYLLGLGFSRLIASAGPALLHRHWDGDPRVLDYLTESVGEIGSLLPAGVRRLLGATVKRRSHTHAERLTRRRDTA